MSINTRTVIFPD